MRRHRLLVSLSTLGASLSLAGCLDSESPGTPTAGRILDAGPIDALAVANSGTGDGTFHAELGATTISDTPDVRVEVSAGETVSAERTVEPHYSEESEELTVPLNWGLESAERTVVVS